MRYRLWASRGRGRIYSKADKKGVRYLHLLPVPITETKVSNHLHPAGRRGMMPKTTDGHQFGLETPSAVAKEFLKFYNYNANRNTRVTRQCWILDHFPLSQLCCLKAKALLLSVLYSQGEVPSWQETAAALSALSQFLPSHQTKSMDTGTGRRVLGTSEAEWVLSLRKALETTLRCFHATILSSYIKCHFSETRFFGIV